MDLSTRALKCPICLDLLKSPATVPCGHSYCLQCISSYWDTDGDQEEPRCPQCRQRFVPRPVLVKNTVLAVLSDSVRGIYESCPDPEDVSCDLCCGGTVKAARSCLQCLASFCESHLEPHFTSANFRKHRLVQPLRTLQDLCTVEKLDQETGSEHERSERLRKLDTQTRQRKMQRKQEDVRVVCEELQSEELQSEELQSEELQSEELQSEELQSEELQSVSSAALTALQDTERLLKQLLTLMKAQRSELWLWTTTQQQHRENPAQKHQERLHRDILELRQKLLGLSNDFTNVTAAISELQDKLEPLQSQDWMSFEQTNIFLSAPKPQPNTRDEFLRFLCTMSLDSNTANSRVRLSKSNKRATLMRDRLVYTQHPNRFSDCVQVLSAESLRGPCYIEVDWSGWGFHLALSYRSIRRSGAAGESRFGQNVKSWSLHCEKSGYEFSHGGVSWDVPGPRSSRVGVFLDHAEGLLQFYSVTGDMVLLHTVRATFTEPLSVGFLLYSVGDFVEFSQLQ